MGEGPGGGNGTAGQAGSGGQVRRLLRVLGTVHQTALAPDPGDVPGREGGDPRSVDGAGPGAGDRTGRLVRARDRGTVRHRGPRTRGRQVARRHGPLGLADADPRASRHRRSDAPVPGGRGRSGTGLRGQSARPAPRRSRRNPRHHGPRPRIPDRREGGRRRCHRQGRRDRHHLPPRAAAALARVHWLLSPGSPRRTRSSWSRSATAPHPGRPTSWPAISSRWCPA